MSSGPLELENFQIYPTTFSLMHGEYFSLKILFSPEEAKVYEEALLIACDNCQIKRLVVQGKF